MQCIARIEFLVKNILILKRLKGLSWVSSYVKLSIFFSDCWTANAYLTFSWTTAKLWSYLWCSFSHFIYILESFERRLNTFLCYALAAFTNFHHAITTRFKCTSCAVDLSNERQLQKQRHHFFFFLLDTFNFLFITSPWCRQRTLKEA